MDYEARLQEFKDISAFYWGFKIHFNREELAKYEAALELYSSTAHMGESNVTTKHAWDELCAFNVEMLKKYVQEEKHPS